MEKREIIIDGKSIVEKIKKIRMYGIYSWNRELVFMLLLGEI